MNERAYYGHESQLFGVEEYRLAGGKGDGMRLLQVKNGLGLEFTVSADRCADIARLSLHGQNCGFFSVNGYVDPAYYDDKQAGWLKNFTAGFLTTCGLLAVGSPCTDEGQELPLHGAIDNIPAEHILWDMDEEKIWIKATMRHAQIFAEKRAQKPIETTADLVAVVDAAIPKAVRRKDDGHPARRTFQAVRIAVNDELAPLENALRDFVELLAPGGRLLVITFHSLEDRIVKNTFRAMQHPCTCPPKAPICTCGKVPLGKVLGGGGVKPSNREVQENVRARSAKMRIFEKNREEGE